MNKDTRQLPEWSKDIKKWMGEQGAMSNLQRDFVFFIEDSLVQPLRKKALDEKDKRVIAEKKARNLNYLTDQLAEQLAAAQHTIDKLEKQLEHAKINQTTTI